MDPAFLLGLGLLRSRLLAPWCLLLGELLLAALRGGKVGLDPVIHPLVVTALRLVIMLAGRALLRR